jgi:hypothetical protein
MDEGKEEGGVLVHSRTDDLDALEKRVPITTQTLILPGGRVRSTMTPATAPPRWADLPFRVLYNISRHLHDDADYVRFHAVCKAWRATLPPAPPSAPFLPWVFAAAPAPATGRIVAPVPRRGGWSRRRPPRS